MLAQKVFGCETVRRRGYSRRCLSLLSNKHAFAVAASKPEPQLILTNTQLTHSSSLPPPLSFPPSLAFALCDRRCGAADVRNSFLAEISQEPAICLEYRETLSLVINKSLIIFLIYFIIIIIILFMFVQESRPLLKPTQANTFDNYMREMYMYYLSP